MRTLHSTMPSASQNKSVEIDSGDTYIVIPNFDLNAGFTALLKFALNGIRNAVSDGRIPVVYLDRVSTFHFFDPEVGENVWDYYFEPPGGITYAQLREAMNREQVAHSQVRWVTPAEAYHWHSTAPDRLATLWQDEEFENAEQKKAWFIGRREEARRVVSQHLQVKEPILEKVEMFWKEYLAGGSGPVFGVQIRGSDFGYADPCPPETYFAAIDRKIADENLPEFRIFVATDQAQFVTDFEERYGKGRVLSADCIRSTGSVAPFKLKGVSPYQKGEDVLIDIMLLSRCDFLYKCAAAVGEAALWFNPDLECEDFSLTSETDSRGYESQQRAFFKMELGESAKWARFLSSRRAAFEQFLECHIFAFGPRKSRWETMQGLGYFVGEWLRFRRRSDIHFSDNFKMWVNAAPMVHNAFPGDPEESLEPGEHVVGEALASRSLTNPHGLFWDGWCRRRAELRVRPRVAGVLTIFGEMPEWAAVPRSAVRIFLKGRLVGRLVLEKGHFELKIPPSEAGRTVELRLEFERDFQLPSPDERVVAACLKGLKLN